MMQGRSDVAALCLGHAFMAEGFVEGSTAEVLREIVALDATLGRVKMDWELPAWDEGRLRSHADALAEKSDALLARKEKEGLLWRQPFRH